MSYYILQGDERKGPYTIGQLRSMWNSGAITRETLHAREGYGNWVPLEVMINQLEPAVPVSAPAGVPPPVSRAAPVRQAQAAIEETIFSDNGVIVTTARVIILGTTYALRNITSVRMACTPAETRGLIILGVCSIFALLGAVIAFTSSELPTGVGLLVIAVVMIGSAAAGLYRLKDSYHVAISSASGEAKVFTSKSSPYIQLVVNAVNEAIVRYRS